MNWDDFANVPDDAPARKDEQFCPDGTQVATIGWVRLMPKEWAKREGNKKGQCLVVRLDVAKGIKAVFDTIPCHRRGAIEALCRSARIPPPTGNWNEQVLVDQEVTIQTALSVSRAGNEFVKVVSYKPAPAPLPEEVRSRPARTATQKADAASAANMDDIPF